MSQAARSESAASLPLPPGPRGWPVVGIVPEVSRIGTPEVLWKYFRRYGEVVSLPIAGRNMILLSHPDHVRYVLNENRENYVKGVTYDSFRLLAGTGLVSSEGAFWKRQRKLAQPAFHHKQIALLGQLIVTAANDMLKDWDRHGAGRFDLHEEMVKLTLRIVGEALFAQDLTTTTDASSRAFAVAITAVMDRGNSAFNIPLSVPTPGNLRLKAALKTLDGLVYAIIEKCRRDGKDNGTLLAMLLSAVDDETGEGMSDAQLRDEVITMFIAGHETTALALSWTWHLLAQNPAVLEKLEAELQAVLGGRSPAMEDYPKLRYTRMVLDESMRVKSPVWTVARDVVADDAIGGFRIPAGSMVMLSQYVTHQRPDFWPEPTKFDPERFTTENAAAQHKYAYFPFSAGPRVCIGNMFSIVEGTLVLAAVCQRYRMAAIPGHVVVGDPQITYRPKGGLPMMRTPRPTA